MLVRKLLQKARGRAVLPLWRRFSPKNSIKGSELQHVINNDLVSTSVAAPCTLRDVVEHIASHAATPISIENLDDKLDSIRLSRPKVCSNQHATSLFDQIAQNFPTMFWWISDKGLNMVDIDPVYRLKEFDRVAGQLASKHWIKGRLSKESFLEIAKELDAKRFVLRDELQPEWRKKVSGHNQKAARKEINSFEKAALDFRFRRGVRRRLYVARERYEALCSHRG
jgi:hypothetical protein